MAGHEKFKFKSRAEFLAKASELGVEIPFSENIGILLEKVGLAGKTLPNRLVVHPMEGADAQADGSPGELTFRRYQRFASGGSGLVWFEATAVTPDGKSNPRQLQLCGRSGDGFKRLVEKARAAGRKRLGSNEDQTFILQLTHSGRFSKPAGRPAPVIAQHSPLLDQKLGIPPDHSLIGDEKLDKLQERFITAAALAREAGFDGIDIKASHGYLVSDLLAARTRRDSRYGGPIENRSRFLIETAKAIKDGVRGLVVCCRLGVYDSLPYPYGFGVDRDDEKKEDLGEPIELIRSLAGIGIRLVNVSLGIPQYKPFYGRPFDKPVPGGVIPDEHPLMGVSRLLRLTGRLQRAFPLLAFVGTGYSWLRQFFPHVAAAIVEAGNATLVGLGREALAYPDFAAELAENGCLDRKKVCLTCSGCSRLLSSGCPVGCIVRDKGIYRIPKPSPKAKL